MDFLKAVLKQTSDFEPPRDYFYWAALCVIAAVTKGKVYLDRFSHKLYPNIYVLLLGKSGMRKTAVINFAKKLVNMTNTTRVVAGRNTIEGIIHTLSQDYTLEGGTIIKRATAFIAGTEFSALIQDNDAAMTILTDLYDTGYHDDKGWKNTLKTSESEILRGVNLTMLGATNRTHLEDKLSTKDILGGFIARTFLVDATKKRTLNALVRRPDNVLNYKHLLNYLDSIKSIEGPFDWEPEAADYYENWYMKFNKQKEEQDDDNITEDTGMSARFEDHVLKVAMLLSLSRGIDLTLTKDLIEEAISACFPLLHTAETLMLSSGKDQSSYQEKSRMIFMTLMYAPQGEYISRRNLLRRLWGKVSPDELDIAIKALNEGELIEVMEDREGKQYRLLDRVYEQLKKKETR